MMGWKQSGRRRTAAADGWSVSRESDLTLRLVDVGLLLVIVVAPFFMGGRQPLGQLVLCVLAAATAFAWAAHQWTRPRAVWHFTGAEPLILIGLGVILFQCVELSPDLVRTISPRLVELLPLWSEDATLMPGAWTRISVTPTESWSNFVVIVACALVFSIAAQRIRTTEDIQKALQTIAVGGVAMAVLALAQYVAGNGRFFWLYEDPMSSVGSKAKGAFTNANHFANFVAMSLPAQFYRLLIRMNAPAAPGQRPSITGYHRSTDTVQQAVWMAAITLSVLTVLLSSSRGGMICSFIGIVFVLLIYWRKSLLSGKVVISILSLAVVGLGATLLFGDRVTNRLESNVADITSVDVNELDDKEARRNIWAANLKGIPEFPLLGTGLGSHHEVYWLWYEHPHDGKEFSHAENGYLQIALETGLIGFGIFATLMLLFAFWCVRGLWRARSAAAAGAMAVVTAGLIITLLHSVSDFVWYAPACVNVVLLFAVCAARIGQRGFEAEEREQDRQEIRTPGRWSVSRLAWGAALPVIAVLGVWMVREKWPEVVMTRHYSEYVRLTLSQQKAVADSFNSAETLRRRRIEQILAAAQADPRAHRVQFHAGIASLEQFLNYQIENKQRMPLSQIREAALASFDATEEMNEWLSRPAVMGDGRRYLEQARDHFYAALKHCPMQPRAYLELAELAWLDGVPQEQERELIRQAVAVRPHDGRSLFALGRIHFEDGDLSTALAYWKESFRLNPAYRRNIIDVFAIYLPVTFFLENFETDRDSLSQLRTAYRDTADLADYHKVLRLLAEANVKEALRSQGTAASRRWLDAHQCYVEMDQKRAAFGSIKEALKHDASSFAVRQAFGFWLYDQGAYREAVEHLTWCHHRRPDSKTIQARLERALVEAERNSAAPATAVAPAGGTRR